MAPNPILTEIRHTRDELARKSGYDVRKFMDFIREREREALARGVKFAPPGKASGEGEVGAQCACATHEAGGFPRREKNDSDRTQRELNATGI